MSKVKTERNYYPHAVVGMIIGCVIACGYTIKIALDNPVEMDTYYMEKYQNVDENINEILELQEKFNANFTLAYSSEKFHKGQNEITLRLTTKRGEVVENADITLMLSRPETNKENQTLRPSRVEKGLYTFGPFTIEKEGRWQLLSKIQVGEFKGYHKDEAYAVK
ncbi:FixH family protein [Sulfurospirillum deleyianum]|uniref:4-hydroxy-3-methylbut-2-en-1-yl diphosphate synthase (1-hydroxy-2-methyl-2-(E)-butenyl 4-diphosphate synthase) n=1 Tax=Sulfurospirillum deleyianum (strain ATCC 51133 / DSM 6946 / 5175) TaxID=525898 RepID=D1B4A7_SULD5|nr:FixH family protein [Sulfurospirillum deleyianum]ACZ12927.1 4-hydroxy-3-methylbut-2-en-1-yl diphosphate synthase (1-hydroxy-2-methyl-2-(E)-butenyl 4-diphosphate synthase) [Sulfurospirillum deleyianum DSM 6946]